MKTKSIVSHLLVPLWLSTTVTVAGINDGLVAFYALNGDLLDASGNGQHGVVHTGSIQYRQGKRGLAAWFDGRSCVRLPQPRLLDGASNATLSAWVWFDSGSGGQIVGAGDNRAGLDPISTRINPFYAEDVNFEQVVSGNESYIGLNYGDSLTGLSIGAWHLFTMVLIRGQGQSGFRCYVDTNLVKQSTSSQFSRIAYDVDMPALIGAIEAASPYQFWIGGLDELRLYNRTLSRNEISELFYGSGPPVIDLQPQDQVWGLGDTATFTVAASGSGPLSLQWYFDHDPIPGETNSTLLVLVNPSSAAGSYFVLASNALGSVTSRVATLTFSLVSNWSFEADTFTIWPGYVRENGPISGWNVSSLLTGVNPGTFGGPFTDNGHIPDGTKAAFLQGDVDTENNAATLTQVIRGFAVGQTYWLRYYENARDCCSGTRPACEVQIGGQTIVALHEVSPVGTTNLYHLVESDPFLATSTDMELAFLKSSPQGGDTTLLIDNVSLIAVPPNTPPTITVQPQDQLRGFGGTATFRVKAVGSLPLHYQWYFSNAAIADATNATLYRLVNSTNVAGGYFAIVMNSVGSATSRVATLTFAAPNDGLIAYYPLNGDLLDASGHGNDGVVRTGSIEYRQGRQGLAAWFDGQSCVQLPQPRLLDGAAEATLSAWVWLDTQSGGQILGAGDSRGGRDPVSTRINPFGAEDTHFTQVINDDEKGIGFDYGEPFGGLSVGAWHLFTMVLSREGAQSVFQCYVDTTLVKQSTSTEFSHIAYDTDMPALIGAIEVESPWQFWIGGLDDIRLYDRPLSGEEVGALFYGNGPPTIDMQPQDQRWGPGDIATFSTRVFGTRPIKFQWYLGHNAVSGATNSTLKFVVNSPAQAGDYFLVAANSLGSATSQVATLTFSMVSNPSFEADTFTNYPGYVIDNGPITGWEGTGELGVNPGTFGDVFNDNGHIPDGSKVAFLQDVEGAEGAYFTGNSRISQVVSGFNVGQTYVLRYYENSRSCCSGTNPLCEVRMDDQSIVPAHEVPPVGTDNPYWFVESDPFLATATTMRLSFLKTDPTLGDSTLLLDNVSLVAVPPRTPPRITVQPQDQVIGLGESVTFGVSATGSLPFSYQWHFGTHALAGATGRTFSQLADSANLAGGYYVVIANSGGSVTSRVANLSVRAIVPGLFDTGVDDNKAALADAAVDTHYKLIVNPDGASTDAIVHDSTIYPIAGGPWIANTPTSKWIAPRADSSGAIDGTYLYRLAFDLTGFDLPSVVITANWASDDEGIAIRVNGQDTGLVNSNGFYTLSPFTISSANAMFVDGLNTLDFEVHNGGGPTGLRVAGLRGLSALPGTPALITMQPQSQTAGTGDTVTFAASAFGSSPLTYQWRKNGSDIAGANAPTLVIKNLSLGDAGVYSLKVSNAFGVAVSDELALTVLITVPGLFNTGVDDAKALLPDGAIDPHYTLVASDDPNFPGPDTFVVLNNGFPLPDPWIPDGPESKWIGVAADQSSGPLDGFYDYQLKFDLTGFRPETVVLSGQFSTDNEMFDILLNGNSTGINNGFTDVFQWSLWTSFTITNGFMPGANMLVFHTHNDGGPAGLRVERLRALARANAPPVADASATALLAISPNNTNATVILDGSLSSDPDGDLLQYTWYEAGSPLGSGVVAVTVLPVGTHSILLVVNDGTLFATNEITIEVITAAEAVNRLAAALASDVLRAQPLAATLRAAMASVDRSNPVSAINQLLAFQNQVRAQVSPLDPSLAASLIQSAQEIIDALSGGNTNPGGHPHGQFTSIMRQPNGRVRMQFSAQAARTYIVEASTNLVDWEMIGVAAPQSSGQFTFEDAQSARFASRFYRIFTPQ